MARTVESGWSYIKTLTRAGNQTFGPASLGLIIQIMSKVLLLYDVGNAEIRDSLKKKGCFFLNCYPF